MQMLNNFWFLSEHCLVNITRKLSLQCSPEMNKYLNREAKFLKKFINPSNKKRKTYFDDGPPKPSGHFSLKPVKQTKESSRRVAVLNTLFMKHISDMLVNGNIAVDVAGKGLEITRVSMAQSFDQLNIFWATTKEENYTALETMLPDVGFTLRHELSQLRVMGVVPRINFVKDKQYGSVKKVDYLLSIADYGEDHEPVTLGSDFKAEPAVAMDHLKTSQVNTVPGEGQTLPEDLMPVMRHDVFNLCHDRIMHKLMKSVKKSRALHRFQPNLAIECDGTGSSSTHESTPVESMTKQERKDALAKFVLGRKILLEKQRQNKYQSELNVPHYGAKENGDDDVEDENFETEDYIEDDELVHDQQFSKY